jgi:hypothetical protein
LDDDQSVECDEVRTASGRLICRRAHADVSREFDSLLADLDDSSRASRLSRPDEISRSPDDSPEYRTAADECEDVSISRQYENADRLQTGDVMLPR